MEIINAFDEGIIDRTETQYPSVLYHNQRRIEVPPFATLYGFVTAGKVCVDGIEVPAGMAFTARSFAETTNSIAHETGCFTGFLRYGFRGQRVAGVELENEGRVQYIDGCTDSVLIPPPRLGDPCLNSLHFPPKINQSHHTHPSIRLGVVASGSGIASTKKGDVMIKTGDAWCIDANEVHRFRTMSDNMIVIAFHPDSDWGPTDQKHPMINRTYIK